MCVYDTLKSIDMSYAKDLVSIIGTFAAILIGYKGLDTWKQQLKGTNRYDVARKAMIKTYEVQQAIQFVRNPVLYLNKEEVDSGNKIEEEQKIYDERLHLLQIKLAELQVIQLESKASYGQHGYDVFDEINDCSRELKYAIWLHFWLKGAFAGPEVTIDRSSDRVIQNNAIVYYSSEEDAFSIKLKESVRNVESFFKKAID